MSITNFIKDFSENFEETDESLFLPNTKFIELDEWDSLTGLAVLNMLKVKYNKLITAEELLKISTIEELYQCTIYFIRESYSCNRGIFWYREVNFY